MDKNVKSATTQVQVEVETESNVQMTDREHIFTMTYLITKGAYFLNPLIIIMIFGIILFGYYGIMSAIMFNPEITISTNINNNNNNYNIRPCVTIGINKKNSTICSRGYLPVETKYMCKEMYDRFNNTKYPSTVCLLDNYFCNEMASCTCLDEYEKNSLKDNQVMWKNNYVLIVCLVMIGIFSIILFLCIFHTITISYIANKFENYLLSPKPNDKETKEFIDVLNCKSCCGIWIIVFIISIFLIFASIMLPISTFAEIKGDQCDYVCNTCYFVNYTLNPIIEVECLSDNNKCYNKLANNYGAPTINYNYIYYFNAANTWNPYAIGVVIITVTVLGTIVYYIMLAILFLAAWYCAYAY